MIIDGLDCDRIQEGYLRTICEGTSHHSPEEAAAYRKLWLTGNGTPLQEQQPIDLPCIHRGEFLETGKCNLCGGEKGQPFEILACAVHGRCSLNRRHSKVKSCLACEDRPHAS